MQVILVKHIRILSQKGNNIRGLDKSSPIFKHLMKCNFYQYYFNLLIILDDDDDNVNLRR